MADSSQWRFATKAIHAGVEPDPVTGAIMTPIYQTSTYHQAGLGKDKGYVYSRVHNPTRTALEQNLAALEGGHHGLAFASGMSAIHALVALLKSGDHVIVSENVYGGTFRLFHHVVRDLGIDFSWVDTSDLSRVEGAIRSETRLLFVETPTNPLLVMTDLRGAAELTHTHGIRLIVDNTFMTPYFQRPLELGADVVIHSTTKYLNGHSDVVGGVLVLNDDEIGERLRFAQKSMGAVPGPMDAWLVLRGVKTLSLRMEAHQRSAQRIAEWLEGHEKVERVFYPGLPSHPQHELAQRQMSGFGGMISFDTGSVEGTGRFCETVRLFALAESLGGVESLVCHPASMTHAVLPEEDRERMGITDSLIRLSVGVEDVEDLLADLDEALAAV